ncbi:hypothetical protein BKA62DRAFT_832377 [Auriculariales sp. MPI-PUGE-AT-0066]|nr:hypothetical protein BKA62DRAFT_832377 [Auriculariales sp. MPI-PUGE-AT-0066]
MTSALADYGARGAVFKEVKFGPSAGSTALRDALAVSELGPEFAQSLQEVSADAASWKRGGTVGGIDWDGCVYAAYVYPPGATPAREPGTPLPRSDWSSQLQNAESVTSRRFQFEQYPPKPSATAPTGGWFEDVLETREEHYQTPPTLAELMAPVIETDAAITQEISVVVIRKLMASGTFTLDLNGAALHQFGRVYVDTKRNTREMLAYLFDGVLVIAMEVLDTTRITLRPIYVIHLGDINKIAPIRTNSTDYYGLQVECTLEDTSRAKLVFSVDWLDDAVRWITILGRQTHISKLPPHSLLSSDIESSVDSAVMPLFVRAMDAWLWRKLSTEGSHVELGRLQRYSLVKNNAVRQSSFMACLFDNYLLFLARGAQLPILQGFVRLQDVVALYDRSQYILSNPREVLCVRGSQQYPYKLTGCQFIFDLGPPDSYEPGTSNGALWKKAIDERAPGVRVDMSFEEAAYSRWVAMRAAGLLQSPVKPARIPGPTSALAPGVARATPSLSFVPPTEDVPSALAPFPISAGVYPSLEEDRDSNHSSDLNERTQSASDAGAKEEVDLNIPATSTSPRLDTLQSPNSPEALPSSALPVEGTSQSKPVVSQNQDNSISGVVFLSTSVGGNTAEYNLTVSIRPEKQSRRIGTSAIAHALDIAFDTLNAHRVQARILHPTETNDKKATERHSRVISKFLHIGFTHEGVRRRAIAHSVTGVWMDMTVLALLDYDWTLKKLRPPPPRMTLWEEMFARQQREHEALLRMDGGRTVKRSRSSETVRNLREINDAAVTRSMVGTSVAFPDHASSVATTVSSSSSWNPVSTPSMSAAASFADDAADEYASWDDFEDDDDDEELTEDSDDDA